MANSDLFYDNNGTGVVNCFQISNFVLWQTAKEDPDMQVGSCELLSN